MVTWVKKVAKIHRTLGALESHKISLPLMSPAVATLINFLKKGAFFSLVDLPSQFSRIDESDASNEEESLTNDHSISTSSRPR